MTQTNRMIATEENGIGAPVVPIWNTETLRAYVIAKMDGLERLVLNRIDSLEHLTKERWEAAENRLASPSRSTSAPSILRPMRRKKHSWSGRYRRRSQSMPPFKRRKRP